MELGQITSLKMDACNGDGHCICQKCNKSVKNCADCTEDAKVRSGLIAKPDKNKCYHLTPHFCSVKKMELQIKIAKQKQEFFKGLECGYCGTKGKFNRGYNGVICKICKYSFDPRNKDSGKLPKELLDREQQEYDRDGHIKKPKKFERPNEYQTRKSKVTGTDRFTIGEFGDLKKGKKIVIGP